MRGSASLHSRSPAAMSRGTAPRLLLTLLLAGTGCGQPPPAGDGPRAGSSATAPAAAVDPAGPAAPSATGDDELSGALPVSMRPCATCHSSIVREYLAHGMAASLGPLGEPPRGEVESPHGNARYEVERTAEGAWLTARYVDGGERRQRLVGRIGAGIFDVSWVGEEVDVVSGAATGRLFFAPVESVTGHGLELSPFESRPPAAGLDLPLDEGCLGCHTDSDPGLLPDAARAVGEPASSEAVVFPSNALGGDAFAHLEPIGCASCHGGVADHLEFAAGLSRGVDSEEIGILRLGRLEPGRQRDLCARCHLQGDVRFELEEPRPGDERPLAGRLVALVPAEATPGFRFVGQLERLALSACFRGAPQMTCTTCHRPHAGVVEQGVAAFDAACASCHRPERCSRPPQLEVEQVTGRPGRSAAGCVDCHLRRSQPFDLPHVASVDHFVRRRIPLPESGIPHREFARPDGAVRPFDDGRLEAALGSPAGRRWRDGMVAMGLTAMGRFAEAAELFDGLPAPGTAAARTPSAPPVLTPLETAVAFHESRGLALVAVGRPRDALAAFSDALELSPLSPPALLGRARLRAGLGDVAGAMADSGRLIEAFPRAEQPWGLRLRIAERGGRPDLALAALSEYTRIWPSSAVAWTKLGLLLRQAGEPQGAERALAQGRRLDPTAGDRLAGGPAPRPVGR